MLDLTNIKHETVVYFLGLKYDIQDDILTGAKWRLDGIKIRRLDINLWKLSTKLDKI